MTHRKTSLAVCATTLTLAMLATARAHAQQTQGTQQTHAQDYADQVEIETVHMAPNASEPGADAAPTTEVPEEDRLLNEQLEDLVPE